MGVEVNASASIPQGDFNGLREHSRAARKALARGIVFYTGEEIMPFQEPLWALPPGVLWAGGEGAAQSPAVRQRCARGSRLTLDA